MVSTSTSTSRGNAWVKNEVNVDVFGERSRPLIDRSSAELERHHIERVYESELHNVQRAAIRLGIPRSSLYQKLARLGLLRKSRERASAG